MNQAKVIAGRYRVLAHLGQGALGSVYKVADTFHEDRVLALKQLRPELVCNQTIEQIKLEFDIMTRLSHPNLVQVYDLDLDPANQTYFLTMEYAQGSTLKQILRQGAVALEEAERILVVLCRALAFIHARGIVHRDIKPGNIMLHEGIKVMDFGIADLGAAAEQQIKGTPMYMSPEHIHGTVRQSADIFSMGVTLFEMLQGKKYFTVERLSSLMQILGQKSAYRDYMLKRTAAVQPDYMRTMLWKMLAFDGPDRYQSAVEIIQDLNLLHGTAYLLETSETAASYVLGAAFINREREMDRLRQHLRDGSSRLLLLEGAAGMGKSRLFQQFRKDCRIAGLPVYTVAGTGSDAPYSAVLKLVGQLLFVSPATLLSQFGPDLKVLLPGHGSLKEITPRQVQTPEVEKGLLRQALADYLHAWAAGQTRGAVVLIIGLHTWDDASVGVLREWLAQRGTHSRVRLFAAMDAEDGQAARRFFPGNKGISPVALGPFGPLEVRHYLEAVFGANNLHESLQAAVAPIQEKVGGNPLFLQEFIRMLVDKGYIRRKSRLWHLTETWRDCEVPDTLTQVVQKRLARLALDRPSRSCLAYIALAGRPVNTRELLLFLGDAAGRDWTAMLERLVRLELVTDRTERNTTWYKVTHGVIGQAVTAMTADVKDMHLRIGRMLEKAYAGELESHYPELAHHFQRSGENETALFYLQQAGLLYRDRFANERAIACFRAMLERIPEKDTLQQINTLLQLSDLLQIVGRWRERQSSLEQALELAQAHGLGERAAKCRQVMGLFLRQRGQFDKALSMLDTALRVYRKMGNTKEVIETIGNIGYVQLSRNNYQEAEACFQQQHDMAHREKLGRFVSSSLGGLGHVCLSTRRFKQAKDYFLRCLDIARAKDNLRLLNFATINLAAVSIELGQYDDVARYLEINNDLARKEGRKLSVAANYGNMGVLCVRQGKLDDALAYYRKDLELSEEIGCQQAISLCHGNIGQVYLEKEDYDRSRLHLEKAVLGLEQVSSKALRIMFGYDLARLHLLQHRFKQAKELSADILAMAQNMQDSHSAHKCRLLLAKTDFALAETETGRQEVLEGLRQQAAEKDKPEYAALTLTCLFELTDDDAYGKQAWRIFHDLYQREGDAALQKSAENLRARLAGHGIAVPETERIQ